MDQKPPARLIVSRSRLAKPDDPDRPYVVHVYDEAGKLILWSGPLSVRERDKIVHLFRHGKPWVSV